MFHLEFDSIFVIHLTRHTWAWILWDKHKRDVFFYEFNGNINQLINLNYQSGNPDLKLLSLDNNDTDFLKLKIINI